MGGDPRQNWYGFAGQDPINFSDPFGLCPKNVADGAVCLDFFISQACEMGFKGDGRSFDADAPASASRIQIVVTSDGVMTYMVSDSCGPVGCFPPRSDNDISLVKGTDGTFTVGVHAKNSAAFGLAPAIDASVTFTPTGTGGYTTSGSRDAMPSLGIYQRSNGG